jgi:hypothetical protein
MWKIHTLYIDITHIFKKIKNNSMTGSELFDKVDKSLIKMSRDKGLRYFFIFHLLTSLILQRISAMRVANSVG